MHGGARADHAVKMWLLPGTEGDSPAAMPVEMLGGPGNGDGCFRGFDGCMDIKEDVEGQQLLDQGSLTGRDERQDKKPGVGPPQFMDQLDTALRQVCRGIDNENIGAGPPKASAQLS